MDTSSANRSRFEPSSVTGLLAVGDLLAIGLFVGAGMVSHGYDLAAHAGRFAGTLTPFLVGWIVVSVPGRLYTRSAIADIRSAVGATLLAWAVAVGIAQILRATAVFPGNAAVTFATVSVLFGGAFLVAWRVAATLIV